MKKRLLLCAGAYVLAIGINFMEAIKYPDSEVGMIHLGASLLFLGSLLAAALYRNKRGKTAKWMLGLFGAAAVGSVLVYLVGAFGGNMYENIMLDALSNIQYPLFILFVVPVFGLNSVLHMLYGVLSLMAAVIYLMLLLIVYITKPSSEQERETSTGEGLN